MSQWRKALLSGGMLVSVGLVSALAGPNGATVVGGTASVQGQGTASVVVNQSSQNAMINWQTFNIGAGESTRINMPSAASTELDRVTGGQGPSQILGSLSSNGRVFLVNPDGILFGQGAQVNVGSLLATTHDIANSDFMAGRYNFSISGNPSASVVNQGTITAQTGGFAALVAPGVRNTGIITAKLGTIALASGNAFTLDLYGDNLITLGVNDSISGSVIDVSTGQPLKSLVSNEGKLKANGGTVALTAVAARQVVDSVINNSGVIEANTIGKHNGMIVLGAATAASKPAGAPTQTVKVSGKLSAAGKRKGTTGGTIEVTGENVQLAGANVDASGRAGGGTVLVGGDWGGGNPNISLVSNSSAHLQSYAVPTATTTSVDAATTIDASAIDSGNGGKVIVWSDQATSFSGTILARGGSQSGDGGFVETSSHGKLNFNGIVDASGSRGANGTLLLDPQDVTIGTTGTWIVTPSAITTALASNNVLITTDPTVAGNGDITVAQGFSWSSANTLVLAAYRNIVINDGVTISNTGAGNLDLGAGLTVPSGAPWYGNGTGTIIFNGSGKINFSNSTGYVTFAYDPPGGYANPTDFSSSVRTNPAVSAQLTAYMWVNNVNDLQNINQNLSGNYLVANTIDASSTAGWNSGAGFIPIGDSTTPFTGTFVGIGGNSPFLTAGATINNLTINSTLPPYSAYTGLFGFIGTGGVVSNVGLTNISVTGGIFTGGLAGWSDGTIYQSYTTGTVTATGPLGVAGGLVGINGELGGNNAIIQSYSNVTVSHTVMSPGTDLAETGGLVGQNNALIAASYSTGATTEIFEPLSPILSVGGLVGHNNGVVLEAYATGLVTGVNTDAGGLIGSNGAVSGSLGPTSVLRSYWDNQTTNQPTDAPATGGPGFVVDSTGLTTASFKSGLPTGLDPTVWGRNPSINNGYPYLLWQNASASSATILQPMTVSPPPSPTPTPNPAPPTVGLPPNTSPFPTGQTSFFLIPINLQVAGSTPSIASQNARSEKAWGETFEDPTVIELEAELALKLQVAAASSGLGPEAIPPAELVTDALLNAKTAWEASDEFKRGHYWMASDFIVQATLGEFVSLFGAGTANSLVDAAELVTAIATVYTYHYVTNQ